MDSNPALQTKLNTSIDQMFWNIIPATYKVAKFPFKKPQIIALPLDTMFIHVSQAL